ncbi:hypothetical protein E2C01_079658 [Portunus trituberculatus]|uniref:Uncharacterized protein n=1 Tax=Portunus trituberculatus TaxID=210409 RepID=A0A5B7ITD2_PORTR|nr:hypothetical protein [Portunus trituberculatus]
MKIRVETCNTFHTAKLRTLRQVTSGALLRPLTQIPRGGSAQPPATTMAPREWCAPPPANQIVVSLSPSGRT